MCSASILLSESVLFVFEVELGLIINPSCVDLSACILLNVNLLSFKLGASVGAFVLLVDLRMIIVFAGLVLVVGLGTSQDGAERTSALDILAVVGLIAFVQGAVKDLACGLNVVVVVVVAWGGLTRTLN